jgi:hypothetical protein
MKKKEKKEKTDEPHSVITSFLLPVPTRLASISSRYSSFVEFGATPKRRCFCSFNFCIKYDAVSFDLIIFFLFLSSSMLLCSTAGKMERLFRRYQKIIECRTGEKHLKWKL